MPRTVELLPVPAGPGVADLLPKLAAALAGDGPVLLPVAEDSGARIPGLATALGVGEPLAAAEDDPADPTAFVVATSGSTGEPKGALLSAAQLRASAAATEARLGGPGAWLLTLPAWHVAGLQVLLRSAHAGAGLVALDGRESFSASGFATAAGRLHGTRRYVSLVPAQLFRILEDVEATEILAGFDAVLVGGASTPASLQQQAKSAGVRLVTTYGMSETCGGCVYDGVPLDGVHVSLDDDDRISLTGPMVARGYRNRPGHPTFSHPSNSTRTFHTDDLGRWNGDRLEILGRADDVIVTGGHKVSPSLVEAAIAAIPDVQQVVVVGVPDEQWGQVVTAVVQASTPLTLAEVHSATAGLPAYCRPRALVTTKELPLKGPGKPDRQAATAAAVAARHS